MSWGPPPPPINDEGQTVEGGHRWRLDEHGEVEYCAWDWEYHNGPVCRACDDTPCEHCRPGIYQEKCPVASIQPLLPLAVSQETA